MMTLFTHGEKILGVKESKPNFTSRDDVFFPNSTDHYFPQELLLYTERGMKSLETIEAKKKKRKRGREWEEIM